jgi:hypothetical protein
MLMGSLVQTAGHRNMHFNAFTKCFPYVTDLQPQLQAGRCKCWRTEVHKAAKAWSSLRPLVLIIKSALE